MGAIFTPVGEVFEKTHKMAASQTIVYGQPVILNSSGLVEPATATSTAIYGVALKSVTSAASGDYYIPIAVATNDAIFKATATGTLSRANLYKTYDLSTTSGYKINLSGTTYNVFKIVGIPGGEGEKASFGTTCYVKVAARQEV